MSATKSVFSNYLRNIVSGHGGFAIKSPQISPKMVYFTLFSHSFRNLLPLVTLYVLQGHDIVSQGSFDVAEHVSNIILTSKSFFHVPSYKKSKLIIKNSKKNTQFQIFPPIFFMNNFHLLWLGAWNNNFNIIIMLETCSATSNYPWDTISWL